MIYDNLENLADNITENILQVALVISGLASIAYVVVKETVSNHLEKR